MVQSGRPDLLRTALEEAATSARGFPLHNTDLTKARDAYVEGMRLAGSMVNADAQRYATGQLGKTTADALDAINLVCSGER